jgi:hypothetical protein
MPQHQEIPVADAPTCKSEAQCAAEWAAARTFVLGHSAYRLQTYSADFMQTYNPSEGDPQLAAEVNKEPIPGGGYTIAARFFCANLFGCVPNARGVLDAFNRTVSAAGASAGATATAQ